MEAFELDTVTDDAGTARVMVGGVIDFVAASALRMEVLLAIDSARTVEVDLGRLQFMDSSGLSALVAGLNEARRRGVDYRLVSLTPAMRRVLSVTRLIEVMPVEKDPGAPSPPSDPA